MSSSLDFIIKLTDRVTAPLKRVQSQLKSFNTTVSGSFKKIGVGAVALYGVTKSIIGLLSPAEEMERALKSASLGGISSINELRVAAKKFSAEYGTSAIDFVNSASSIKSALTGISDHDVPQAAAAMNLLSKATADSVEASTAYIEQMASSYRDTVNKVGHVNFARHAAGIAAYAKSNFNVPTQQLQSMMQNTKSVATNNGASMAEQSVVLSMASKSLGNSAAGSYAALYENLSKAGKELGLSFSDANGKMLSMPDIIEKIQGKFGKDLSKNIKAQQALDKALGCGADIVNALSNNTDELRQHMKEIGKGQNFKLMQKMAEANVKPLDRINTQFMNIKESVGRALLPVLTPVMNTIGGLIGKFSKWLEMFPNLAKWLGIITVAFMGLTAVAAIFAIISGVISLLLSPIVLVVLAIGAIIALCWVFRDKIIAVINHVVDKFQEFWKALSQTWFIQALIKSFQFLGGIFSVVWRGISTAFNALISVIGWLFNTIVSAFSIIIGVIGDFWNSISDTWIISLLVDSFGWLFDLVCSGWGLIMSAFGALVDGLCAAWDWFVEFFTDFSFFESFSQIGDALIGMFSRAWKNVKNMGISVINTIIDGLNYIPGVNIELLEYEKIDEPENKPVNAAKSAINSTVVSEIEPGGLSREIMNNKSQTIDNSKNIQSVTINNSQPMTPAQLQEWQEVYSG